MYENTKNFSENINKNEKLFNNIHPGQVSKLLLDKDTLFIFTYLLKENQQIEDKNINKLKNEQREGKIIKRCLLTDDEFYINTVGILDAAITKDLLVCVGNHLILIVDFNLNVLVKRKTEFTCLRVAAIQNIESENDEHSTVPEHIILDQDNIAVRKCYYVVTTLEGHIITSNNTFRLCKEPIWPVAIFENSFLCAGEKKVIYKGENSILSEIDGMVSALGVHQKQLFVGNYNGSVSVIEGKNNAYSCYCNSDKCVSNSCNSHLCQKILSLPDCAPWEFHHHEDMLIMPCMYGGLLIFKKPCKQEDQEYQLMKQIKKDALIYTCAIYKSCLIYADFYGKTIYFENV